MNDKDSKKLTGLKKRSQIAKANKTVFLWVAGASVVVSLGLAVGQALINQALFNQKVINEKTTTAQTLKDNIETSKELKKNVTLLLANENLSKAKSNEADNAHKVVLDALPTENEPLAFGSSLQLVLLPKSGTTIDGLTVGNAEAAAAGLAEPTSGVVGATVLPFSFTANGNTSQIKNVLTIFEDSIRPIAVNTLTIEGSDDNLKLTMQGNTWYQEAKTVELQTKAVKP